MNELALFSGAGGGVLGGHLLGWRTVAAVEIEDYPRRVLLQRQADGILPRFPVWDDVCTFDGKPWRGKVDVVTGGFPCQDIAAAGTGVGLSGARSGLWSEQARIIGEVEPSFAYVENSPILTSRGLGIVLGDLSDMGYDARWGVIGADAAGAFHHRARIWVLATHHRQERVSWHIPEEILAKRRLPGGKDGRGREDIKRRSDLPESVLLRRGNDVANYVDRISAIGNGQVPAVAALAWRILSGNN